MVLVTGATGNVGHHVVQMLLDGGVKVRAVTRDPASAGLPAGADLVAGDPSHPQTLEAALRGVEAIFLVPRALGDATAELLQLAAGQGVDRVALNLRRGLFISRADVAHLMLRVLEQPETIGHTVGVAY